MYSSVQNSVMMLCLNWLSDNMSQKQWGTNVLKSLATASDALWWLIHTTATPPCDILQQFCLVTTLWCELALRADKDLGGLKSIPNGDKDPGGFKKHP